jgi:aryl-alcohol dehydrogenase-like predicted oxidoreductase
MAAKFFQDAPEPATELGRYRVLCPLAGIRVSPLALGAMSIGDAWGDFMGSMDKEQSFKLLDAFVAAGGNFIDTANNYQSEQSESWLGEWATSRGIRDQLVLATKYTSDYRSHAEGKGKVPNCAGNHRKSLHLSVRDSLKKLQTEYIDLLYVHWWDHTTSIKEIMDSLHFLVEQGKVLYIGASDMPAWVVSAANTYAIDNGKTPFSVYQGRWSVMQREFERDIMPMARMFGMALVPWNVVGGGKFQTKKALEERKRNGEGLRSFAASGEQSPDEEKMSAALEKVAGEVGVESITAVALAYVMHKAANVVPLVGGRKIEHLEDNIKALSIRLSEEQIEFLESVVKFDVGFPHDFLGPDPNLTGKSARLRRVAPMKFPMAHKPTSV